VVTFKINTGIRKIADKLTPAAPIPKTADAPWLGVGVTISLSSPDVLGTIVADFAFDTPSIIEYTLNSSAGVPDWIAFNNGLEITGGQSRFIDVTDGVEVDFRAKTGGNLIRLIVSSVP
jgi:hypothetical protein